MHVLLERCYLGSMSTVNIYTYIVKTLQQLSCKSQYFLATLSRLEEFLQDCLGFV